MNWDLEIEDEDDVLDGLEDLFDELKVDGPTEDQLYKLYGIFLRDIVNNPIKINGVDLTYNTNISRHPICRGKPKGFEHIITRESKYKGLRDFDKYRANKIHWIKPIIENVNDPRILYYERINDDGQNQRYYWYEDKDFLVIVRELNPEYFLITSFEVDDSEKPKYRKQYNDYNF